MKIRQGFVSNSSSSSFCIFGVFLSTSELKQIIKKHEELSEIELDELDNWEIREKVESILEDFALERPLEGYDDGGAYIGIYPNSLDRTVSIATQEEVLGNKLKQQLPEDMVLNGFAFHAEGGYDG